MNELTKTRARRIIEVVGASGTPPEWGVQFFTSGLDPYLNVLEEDYLNSFIKDGGSSFKMVVGNYGGGKTHFLYNIRELAWRHNYLVAYCPLTHEESPFFHLEKVFRSVMVNLMYPMSPDELLSGGEKGIESFIRSYVSTMQQELEDAGNDATQVQEQMYAIIRDSTTNIESANFARAVRAAMNSLFEGRDDDFENVIQYLKVDGYNSHIHRKYGILQGIGRSQAFTMLRSLNQWIRNLRYNGLVILFDEAEMVVSMNTKQKQAVLANLRELVDQCGQASLKNTMVFYAVPNDNFLKGSTHVYEALRQRVATVFHYMNPTGVKIRLDSMVDSPQQFLQDVGYKLLSVYETAYGIKIDEITRQKIIGPLSDAALEMRFGESGYMRPFVQGLISVLHMIRRDPKNTLDSDKIRKLVPGGADVE